jgi:hypothetical protein
MSAEETQVMPGLPVLVRTELLKLGTTRAPWLLAGGTLALTVLLALQPVTRAGRDGAPSIGTVGAALGVIDAVGRGALVALLAGVLVVTSEFRHQTVGTTLLQTPNRIQLVVAKSAASSVVGLALGMAALLVGLGIGTVSGGVRPELVNSDIAVRVLGLVLTYPLYALLGVAVGALLTRNQPLAVIVPIVWLLGVEGLAMSALPRPAGTWSLQGVTAALQNAGNVPYLLPVWLGGGVLLSYALLLLAGGAFRLNRTDIT